MNVDLVMMAYMAFSLLVVYHKTIVILVGLCERRNARSLYLIGESKFRRGT